MEAIGCDVLADNSWPEGHGLQSLAIHEQDLTLACRSRMRAALKAGVGYCLDFGKFLHRQALLGSAKKILHSRHGLSLLRLSVDLRELQCPCGSASPRSGSSR